MENVGQGKLYVIIGEKIEVKELTDEKNIMDAKFLAKYKILERVCGDYRRDTVEFIVYDHYGRPAFEDYKTVMLYLIEYEGKFYHEKYLYHDLYKTKAGRWASPYDWLDHDRVDSSKNPPKPIKIDFAEEVSYSTIGLKKREIKQRFPEPFYQIADTKAIAVYGFHVPELFEFDKRGVLTATGLFGKPDTAELKVQEIELEKFEQHHISKKERMALLSTWNKLLNAIETQNTQKIKELSLDSVICSVCEGFDSRHFYNDVEPIDTFIRTSYSNFPNTGLWNHLKKGNIKLSATKYPERKPEHFLVPKPESLIIYEVTCVILSKDEYAKYRQHHSFQFVKAKGVFKFYGMESS
jgi:hypothetical protein